MTDGNVAAEDARDVAALTAAFGKTAAFHWAMGRIVIQYAGLQTIKQMVLWKLIDAEDQAIGMIATEKLSDRLNLDLFCALFRHRTGAEFPQWEAQLAAMRTAVEQAEDRRNAIIHGMYVWSDQASDLEPPDTRIKLTARPKKGLDTAVEAVDAESLMAVVRQIQAAHWLFVSLVTDAFPTQYPGLISLGSTPPE